MLGFSISTRHPQRVFRITVPHGRCRILLRWLLLRFPVLQFQCSGGDGGVALGGCSCGLYNTVARCFLRRRRLQLPEEQNGAADKGLDKSIIEALPVVACVAEGTKSLFGPAGENECVVCLSEYV